MKPNAVTLGQMLYAFSFPLAMSAGLLWLSGDWFWLEGLVWIAWFLILCWATTLYLYFKDPALLQERFQPQKTTNQRKGHAYLYYALMLVFLAWFVLLPLDGVRYRWSPTVPFGLTIGGLVLLGLSFFFIFRSFMDNTFVSPLIRVQSERKQHVVSTGVYGFVRHPMYLGAVLMFIGTPLWLGSSLCLVPSAVLCLFTAARLLGEEKMLTSELEGYGEYRQKVRYRLFPYVW